MRDENGMEDLDTYFSPDGSGKKQKQQQQQQQRLATTGRKSTVSRARKRLVDQTLSDEASMDIVDQSQQQQIIRPIPVMRPFRSPQKTYLRSPALRVPSPRKLAVEDAAVVNAARRITFAELGAEDHDTFDVDIPSKLPSDPSSVQLMQDIPRSVDRQQQRSSPLDLNVDIGADLAMSPSFEAASRRRVESAPMVADEAEFPDRDGFDGGYDDDPPQDMLTSEEAAVVHESTPKNKTKAKAKPKSKGKAKATSSTATARKRTASSAEPVRQQPHKRSRLASEEVEEAKARAARAASYSEDEGVRRSSRVRIAPLAYWKNERVRYELKGRDKFHPAMPSIREIIRVESPADRRPLSTTSIRPSTNNVQKKSRKLFKEEAHVFANVVDFATGRRKQKCMLGCVKTQLISL